MKAYKNKTVMLIVMVMGLTFPASLNAKEETCAKHIESLRGNALTALFRLEEHFKNAGWNYRKYQETVYNPLWEAALKRRARFSKALNEEGETLYPRYRLLADQIRTQAEGEMESVFQELEVIRKSLPHEDSCGGILVSKTPSENISQFNNCMSLSNHETEQWIKKIKKLLKRYVDKQEKFSELLEAHTSDTSSEHDTFEDRYYHHFFDFDLKSQTLFLQLICEIQDRFERKWTAESCCAACSADQSTRWDPVLSQLTFDPQGDSGVAGNLVNNARLKQAFERFEKEQIEEKKENGKQDKN